VAVLTVIEANALEFDAVVVVDLAAILTASVRAQRPVRRPDPGHSRLGVVRPGDLAPVLARLCPVSLQEVVRRPR
jgi:hypothetical protein